MFMKIDGPGSTRATSAGKKADKAERGKPGAFAAAMQDGSDDISTPDNIAAAAPVSSLDALLAIQEVDDATTPKQPSNTKAKVWGEDLLDRLDDIRIGLLLGTIPPHQLENLSNLLSHHKETATDPKLINVISEIEVRALVELAKFQRDVR